MGNLLISIHSKLSLYNFQYILTACPPHAAFSVNRENEIVAEIGFEDKVTSSEHNISITSVIKQSYYFFYNEPSLE